MIRPRPSSVFLPAFGLALVALAFLTATQASELREGFSHPPDSARPHTWWHWMDGNVDRDGITADLDWMKRIGLGGLQQFDVALGTPQVVDQPIRYLSAEWKEAFHHAVEQAHQHGLEFAIASSPGFSITGGPWVTPEDGMKKLVWSETCLEGGAPLTYPLPQPPSVTGPFQSLPAPPSLAEMMAMAMGRDSPEPKPSHYRDVVVLAFPDGGPPLPRPATVAINSDMPIDTEPLMDDDLDTALAIPRGTPEQPTVVRISYDTPQTVQSATIFAPGAASMLAGASWLPYLEARSDSGWHRVVNIPLTQVPTTVSFAAVTAREFRVVFAPVDQVDVFNVLRGGAPGVTGERPPPQDDASIQLAALTLHPEARVDRFETKAGFAVTDDYYALSDSLTPARGITVDEVLDLSAHVRPDGSLDWTPPEGRWRILRLGYSLVGTQNHPAAPEGTGFEVDKYDRAAVERYLNTYLDKHREALGGTLGERGITAILTDSIEVGASNWTDGMIEHFERLRGYDPRPWLPALTGVLVGSREQSDAFLYDFRRTLADLLASAHYGTIAEVAHARGLKVYGEALEDGRPSLGDDMAMRAHADVPMAAFWIHDREERPRPTYLGDIKGAASVAHIYGRGMVAAESLTSANYPWALAPADLKPFMDIQFAHGINRPIIHTSVHQPLNDRQPGLSMRSFGQYFNRHETWAEMATPWVDYMARSSYLLQQGRNVADVLYFHGEEAPLTALFARSAMTDLPVRYAYDFASADVVLNHLDVEDGELVTSGGARYRVLYLGGTSRQMTLPVLRRLAELVAAGATIVGQAPEGSPSLGDDPDEFVMLVSRLWGDEAITSSGRGRVISNRDADSALADLGVLPSFSYSDPDDAERMLFVQRTLADGDIYYLHNPVEQARDIEARFRVTGRKPEIWRADAGTMEPVSYRIDGGQTIIPLEVAPLDAFFVVFREPSTVTAATVPERFDTTVLQIEGPWQVAFQADRGAPPAIELATLTSLSEHVDTGVKYFSGVASYTNRFRLPASIDARASLQLDLGDVGDVAEVRVNGEMAGIAWKLPYRVDIGALVQPGTNSVEIRVANLWVNRLIGDAQPGAEPVTFTTVPTFRPDAPLRPSGLLGPVKILSTELAKRRVDQ